VHVYVGWTYIQVNNSTIAYTIFKPHYYVNYPHPLDTSLAWSFTYTVLGNCSHSLDTSYFTCLSSNSSWVLNTLHVLCILHSCHRSLFLHNHYLIVYLTSILHWSHNSSIFTSFHFLSLSSVLVDTNMHHVPVHIETYSTRLMQFNIIIEFTMHGHTP